MQIDTTASENRPGFRALEISPRSLEEELEAMLKHKQNSDAKDAHPGRGCAVSSYRFEFIAIAQPTVLNSYPNIDLL
jgi:hypothetical protein